MNNKIIQTLTGILHCYLCLILCVSCYNGEEYEITDNIQKCYPQQNENLTWEQQLELIRQRGKEVMTRSRFIHKSQLQLNEYKSLGKIDNTLDLHQVQSTITSNNSYIPYYDIEKKEIQLLNWDDLEKVRQYDNIVYSKQKLSEFIHNNIQIGMEKIQLTWECGSKICKTICIVSDQGIVYDNVISNIICISEEALTTITPTNNNIIKTRGETSGSGWQWRHYETCSWLWGSERGSVELTHTIYGGKNYLRDSNCHADGYMSIGKCGAEIVRNSITRGEGGRSICAYGYYMATPTTDISMSLSGGRYSITISSSGISSPITGTGISELSSAYLN